MNTIDGIQMKYTVSLDIIYFQKILEKKTHRKNLQSLFFSFAISARVW